MPSHSTQRSLGGDSKLSRKEWGWEGESLPWLSRGQGFPKAVLDLRGKLLLVRLKQCWQQSTWLNKFPVDLLDSW